MLLPGSPAMSVATAAYRATSALVAWIYGDAGRLLLIAVALTASDAVIELIALVMPPMAALAGLPRAGVLLILGWLWLISVRAVLVCGGTMRPQLVKGTLVVTAMFAIGFSPIRVSRPGSLAGQTDTQDAKDSIQER